MIGYYEFSEVNVNSIDFWSFTNNTVDRFKTNLNFAKNLNDEKVIFLLDNTKIHFNRPFRAKAVDLRIKFLYNIPYCCFLNSIEYMFAYLKRALRQQKYCNVSQIKSAVQNYYDNNSVTDISSALRYVIKIWTRILNEDNQPNN